MANEIDELKKEINDLKEKLHTEYKAPTQSIPPLQTEESAHPQKNFEEKEIYSWDAPVRIFKRWERNSSFTVAVLCAAGLCLILLALQEYMLAGTIVLLTLLCIILSVIPPLKTHHKITNKGVLSLGKLYLWEELGKFWFAERKGHTIMYIETKLHYPGKLFFLVPSEHITHVVEALNPYIKYLDKTSNQDFINVYTEGRYIHFNDLKKFTPSIS